MPKALPRGFQVASCIRRSLPPWCKPRKTQSQGLGQNHCRLHLPDDRLQSYPHPETHRDMITQPSQIRPCQNQTSNHSMLLSLKQWHHKTNCQSIGSTSAACKLSARPGPIALHGPATDSENMPFDFFVQRLHVSSCEKIAQAAMLRRHDLGIEFIANLVAEYDEDVPGQSLP
jgi:hypothetical protein